MVLRGLRESAGIALAVLALVILVALLTYAPGDPGFSFTGSSDAVRNSIGPVGAYLADLLFFWFGRPAYLLPVMLAVSCWLLFRKRSNPVVAASRLNAAVRIGGFVLTLLASCGLASLHWLPGDLRQSAGGVTGLLVGHGLAGCPASP